MKPWLRRVGAVLCAQVGGRCGRLVPASPVFFDSQLDPGGGEAGGAGADGAFFFIDVDGVGEEDREVSGLAEVAGLFG